MDFQTICRHVFTVDAFGGDGAANGVCWLVPQVASGAREAWRRVNSGQPWPFAAAPSLDSTAPYHNPRPLATFFVGADGIRTIGPLGRMGRRSRRQLGAAAGVATVSIRAARRFASRLSASLLASRRDPAMIGPPDDDHVSIFCRFSCLSLMSAEKRIARRRSLPGVVRGICGETSPYQQGRDRRLTLPAP